MSEFLVQLATAAILIGFGASLFVRPRRRRLNRQEFDAQITIPIHHLRILEMALQRAEAQARAGAPYAGLAILERGLRRVRTTVGSNSTWWGGLVARWQEEVARYRRRHHLESPSELSPSSAPLSRGDEAAPVQ